jgi:uncharacterized protein YecE (DUF72 family)
VKVNKGAVLEEYLIGAGGWAYFQVPGMHPLVAYSKAFNFVEVNSTFYQIPALKDVETWRKLVPPDFQFSVRAHRSLTHKLKLEPSTETVEVLEVMKQICSVLDANFLHLQIPASISKSKVLNSKLNAFLDSVDIGKLRLVLEMRGLSAAELPSDVIKTMQDHNIVHCVDLSKGEMPTYHSDVLYSRLFGKGYHNVYQPTDEELVEIDKKATSSVSKKIMMSFHFVRMYKDATRLKIYKQTGKFPKVTRETGLASLDEVLSEDARFPASKEELIESQGWKLFDLAKDNRVLARDYLQRLPDRTYNNIGDVIETLRSVMG